MLEWCKVVLLKMESTVGWLFLSFDYFLFTCFFFYAFFSFFKLLSSMAENSLPKSGKNVKLFVF